MPRYFCLRNCKETLISNILFMDEEMKWKFLTVHIQNTWFFYALPFSTKIKVFMISIVCSTIDLWVNILTMPQNWDKLFRVTSACFLQKILRIMHIFVCRDMQKDLDALCFRVLWLSYRLYHKKAFYFGILIASGKEI